MSNTFETMKQVIVEKLNVKPEDVTPEKSFQQDLGADSLDLVELIMELESKWNITIPDEDAAKLLTVGNAVEYIDAKLNK
ncbi:MAG: acyl carrier protein [Alphaproteobacteria bacterium]|nr:acyl carrier protein [Alphaproteobacteria bacterium]